MPVVLCEGDGVLLGQSTGFSVRDEARVGRIGQVIDRDSGVWIGALTRVNLHDMTCMDDDAAVLVGRAVGGIERGLYTHDVAVFIDAVADVGRLRLGAR